MDRRESAFNLPVIINYRPSLWVFSCLCMVHFGALICLYPAAIPVWLKWLLMATVLCSYIRHHRVYVILKNSSCPQRLILKASDEWLLCSRDGASIPIKLLPESFVHPWLVVLRFKGHKLHFHAFVLTLDNIDVDILRRLRVRLRYQR